MKKLAIIGAGDLGYQIAYHAKNDTDLNPVGFFDDFKIKDEYYYNLPVLGKVKDVISSFNAGLFDVLMIGIGYKHLEIRGKLFDEFYGKIPFANIIHSSVYVDSSCKLGSGIFIYPRCTLDMNVIIEDNVLLNVNCVIAHDTVIGKHSFLSPCVNVAGFVNIGKRVNLGINTTIIDNIKVADYVKTGGGAVVITDLKEPGLYVGIPAKFKKI